MTTPFCRVLDRAVEDLAAGHVEVPVVDPALASGEAEAKVGLVPDDSHLVGLVEALLDPLHLLALGIPVEEDGPEEEVLELLQAHAGLLGQGGSGVAARDPGDLGREPARDKWSCAVRDSLLVLRAEVGALACVLRCADPDPRVALVLEPHAERRAFGDELRRGGLGPDGLEGPEVHAGEAELDKRDRLATPDRSDHLLDERPRLRAADDEHFPPGLYVNAPLDEERCVVRDSRVGHGASLL